MLIILFDFINFEHVLTARTRQPDSNHGRRHWRVGRSYCRRECCRLHHSSVKHLHQGHEHNTVYTYLYFTILLKYFISCHEMEMTSYKCKHKVENV